MRLQGHAPGKRRLENPLKDLEPRRLNQDRHRLRQPGERRPVREAHQGVQRTEQKQGLERGYFAAQDDDVVCVAELQSARDDDARREYPV